MPVRLSWAPQPQWSPSDCSLMSNPQERPAKNQVAKLSPPADPEDCEQIKQLPF